MEFFLNLNSCDGQCPLEVRELWISFCKQVQKRSICGMKRSITLLEAKGLSSRYTVLCLLVSQSGSAFVLGVMRD